MYYIGVRPKMSVNAFRMEMSNEIAVLILSYHMLCFTEWVGEPEMQYDIGFSFVSFIGYILVSNIVNMGRNMWFRYLSDKRKEHNQKAYENRFKEH